MPTSTFEHRAIGNAAEHTGSAGSAQAAKTAMTRAAREVGFDIVRVTRPDTIGEAGDRLMTFLSEGRHGDMAWMETTSDRRRDPRALWPEVKSIVMLGLNYGPDTNPLDILSVPSRAAISVYAKGRDYHDVMKKKLKELAGLIERTTGEPVKVFVDTAPLMEKPLAAAAGLGWQGKHTNLVSREAGSWLFLGAILTAAELEPDAPEEDHCGSCRRCLDVCPTNAFPGPYQLDARRCIAYLTIEHKGHIAPEFRAPMKNRVFGCDDCLAVCPWNKFAAASNEMKFAATDATANPPLVELLQLDDATFRTRYAGTPVKRTGRDRIVRNTLIAAGNSGDASLIPLVMPLLSDASALVRAMAVWALRRLAAPDVVNAAKSKSYPHETDETVRNEWHIEIPQ
jgi:epoxyqueuosine reductase